MSHDHHDEETLGKPYDARLVRRLMTYVRPYAKFVTLAVLMLVVVTCFELAIPYLTRMALDDYIVANSRLVTDNGGDIAREFIAGHAEDLVPVDTSEDGIQTRYFISSKALSGFSPREVARATELGVVGDERYYLADTAFFEARTVDRSGFLEAGSQVGIPVERLSDFTGEDLHELRGGDLHGVARIALAIIALLILTFGFTLLQINMMEVTSQRVMYDMRMKVLRHLQKLSLSFFDKNPVGRLVTRATNDIAVLHEMFTSIVITILHDMFILIGVIIVLLRLNWRLALVSFTAMPSGRCASRSPG